MKAIVSKNNKNSIIVQNFDRKQEEPIFEAIKNKFAKDSRVTIKQELNGPLENIIKAACNGGEVSLYYDFDYGLCPIRCTSDNLETILEIVNSVL